MPQTADQHLRINPDLALAWVRPGVVRVGFERPMALARVDSAHEQLLLGDLIAGVSKEAAARLRAQPAAAALLAELGPALERANAAAAAATPASVTPPATPISPTPSAAPPATPSATRASVAPAARPFVPRSLRRSPPIPRVRGEHDTPSSVRATLSDDGREVPALRRMLEADWLCNLRRDGAAPELAIEVLRFLEPFERTRRWLGAHVPHLVIRFTDASARVGPLVAATGRPCHTCEALSLVDADAELPGVSAQLVGQRPSSETPAVALAVGVVAVQFIRAWQGGAAWVHRAQLVLPTAAGGVAGLPWREWISPHPECACAL